MASSRDTLLHIPSLGEGFPYGKNEGPCFPSGPRYFLHKLFYLGFAPCPTKMEPLRLAPFPWKLGWQESSFRKPETPNSPRLFPAHEAQNAAAVNPRNWPYPFGKILVEKNRRGTQPGGDSFRRYLCSLRGLPRMGFRGIPWPPPGWLGDVKRPPPSRDGLLPQKSEMNGLPFEVFILLGHQVAVTFVPTNIQPGIGHSIFHGTVGFVDMGTVGEATSV